MLTHLLCPTLACPQRIEGLDSFTSLQQLDLSKNTIKRIERLDRLSNLRQLNLSFNRIRCVGGDPPSFPFHRLCQLEDDPRFPWQAYIPSVNPSIA